MNKVNSKEVNTTKKEKEKLEKLINTKIEQVFTLRIQTIEGNIKGTFSTLRNSVYETQVYIHTK